MAVKLNELVKSISAVAEEDLHWSKVVALSKDKLIVIDIHQDWCGPCETLHPSLHKITLDTAEWQKRVGFYAAALPKLKDQVAELLPADAAATLAKRGCMPYFALVLGGAVVGTVSGADAPQLVSLIRAHMPPLPGSEEGEE